jgi:hypothetical protein
MLTKIKNWFQNKQIERLKDCLEHERRVKMRLSREVESLFADKCHKEYLVHCFQDKVQAHIDELCRGGGNHDSYLNLKEFHTYSYNFVEPIKFGRLATSHAKHNSVEAVNKAEFVWRDIVAQVSDGEFIFFPEQINSIQWKDYPIDCQLFIEWIAHHQKLLTDIDCRLFTEKPIDLKPYSVELY